MKFFEEFRELAESRQHYCSALPLNGPGALSNPVCGDLARIELRRVERGVLSASYNAVGCWPLFGALELVCHRLEDSESGLDAQWSMQEFLLEVEDVPAGKRHAFSLAYRCAVQGLAEATKTGGRASGDRVLRECPETVGEGRKKGYN